MKRTLIVCMLAVLAVSARAVVVKTVHLEKGDSLGALLGNDQYGIDSLIVTGYMDGEDFDGIMDCCYNGSLRGIDLSGAELENAEIPDYALYRARKLQWVSWPEGLRRIGNYALSRTGLREIVVPPTVEEIGYNAFEYCEQATKAVLPEGITELEWRLFGYCSGLKELVLPSTLRFISAEALVGTGIEVLNLPDGLETLQTAALTDMSSLRQVRIPSGIEELPQYVLRNCQVLREAILPSGLRTIGESAFERCYSLSRLVIPATVETVGKDAFEGCQELKEVHCQAMVPPAAWDPNRDEVNTWIQVVPLDAVLYVPVGTKEAYRRAPFWRCYQYIYEEDVTGVGRVSADGAASDGAWRDLQGRRVESPRHGVFLRNGKKFVIN